MYIVSLFLLYLFLALIVSISGVNTTTILILQQQRVKVTGNIDAETLIEPQNVSSKLNWSKTI